MRPLSVFLSCCSIPVTSTPTCLRQSSSRVPLTNALVNDWANYANDGTVFLLGGRLSMVRGQWRAPPGAFCWQRGYEPLSCSVLETSLGGVIIQITDEIATEPSEMARSYMVLTGRQHTDRDEVGWPCGGFWRHLSAHRSTPELRFCPSFVGEAPHTGSTLMINHRTKGQTARVHPRDG